MNFPEMPRVNSLQVKDLLNVNGNEIWCWSVHFYEYSDKTVIKVKTDKGEMITVNSTLEILLGV
jgi:hypothetical protein